MSNFTPQSWRRLTLGLLLISLPRLVVAQDEFFVPPPSLPAPAASGELLGPLVANPEDGVFPLEQGPIHEAFAELIVLEQRNGFVVPQAPPAAINEIPPEVRPEGSRVEWFPGYWSWSEDLNDFIWISGVWRDVPPGQQFVPGYWNQTADGYVWVSGFWTAEAADELAYLPAPPATLEIAPTYPQPAADYFWVPGCWLYQSNNYVWQAGFWNRGYDNWVWVPNRYVYTPRGCVYLRGYWDYPLANRGCLFTPVRFRQPIYRNIGFRFTPYRWVNTSILLSRLFIAPTRGHYYFGNFSGPRYVAQGYRPWINVGQVRGGYDPFFAYNSWSQGARRNSNWLNDYRHDFSRLAAQPVGDTFQRGGGSVDNYSRDLFRDLRDQEHSSSFVRLTSSQRDAAVESRVVAFNTLRDQRAAAEVAIQSGLNDRREGFRTDGQGSIERSRTGEESRRGSGSETNSFRNDISRIVENGRTGTWPDLTAPDPEIVRERGSFRLPESARNTLNRASTANVELPADRTGNAVTGPVDRAPRDLNLPSGDRSRSSGVTFGTRGRMSGSEASDSGASSTGRSLENRGTLSSGSIPGGMTRERNGVVPNDSQVTNPSGSTLPSGRLPGLGGDNSASGSIRTRPDAGSQSPVLRGVSANPGTAPGSTFGNRGGGSTELRSFQGQNRVPELNVAPGDTTSSRPSMNSGSTIRGTIPAPGNSTLGSSAPRTSPSGSSQFGQSGTRSAPQMSQPGTRSVPRVSAPAVQSPAAPSTSRSSGSFNGGGNGSSRSGSGPNGGGSSRSGGGGRGRR